MMFTIILMITTQHRKRKFQAIIKELFVRCRKLNISVVFITQYCFSVSKEVRLNSAHYLMMKIHNKRELQLIAINHLANFDHEDFMKIYNENAQVTHVLF